MDDKNLIRALRKLKIETGSLACMECGHEHNCGIHGCAIIREAAEQLGDFNAVFNEETIVRLAGRCLKVEPARLRELAEADRDGRVVVLPFTSGGNVMGRLWDYCAFCGKRIETGEKCYGLPNGESVCTDCCVAENEGAAVSDGEKEQEGDNG